MVVQSVKPWMSDEDIAAGSRWLAEVSSTLNSAKIGLICVTPENQHNPWLLFEAGALSKTLEQLCVCPLVFEMTPGQLAGPLTQFQANRLDRDGIGRVVATINRSLGEREIDPRQLEEILNVWWPSLEAKLDSLRPAPAPVALRSTANQLEELLALARENLRRENLRLEASNGRDEKLDSMISFMEFAAASLSSPQNMQAIHSPTSLHADHGASSNSSISRQPNLDFHQLTGSSVIAKPPEIDIKSMTGMLREMQEQDRRHTAKMLIPDPPES